MSVTVQNVRDRAKEFASLTDNEIQAAIDDAALQINRDVWGTRADLGTIYLAAHTLGVQNPSLVAAAGPVSSETVGAISRTYAVPTPSSGLAGYASSRWGAEYLRLLRQTVLPAQVT